MERQRKPGRDFWMGEKLPEGKGRKNRDEDRRDRPASLPASLRQPPPPQPGRVGQGTGVQGSPPGHPVQGAAWGKLGGRIVISVGVLLNYTTSYLSPGGAAGGQTDGWTDRRGPGRAGRAGEAPAAMVSPRHGPTDTSLCAAKAPQGRFYGWVPGPRNPGPRPPPPQGTQESVSQPLPPRRSPESRPPSPHCSLRFKSPSPQAPLLPRGPRRPGPRPLPQTRESSQACLLWRRRSPASGIPGPREPHQFQSLATWASSLPPYLSDNRKFQERGGGRPGAINRCERLSGYLLLSRPCFWPLIKYHTDSWDCLRANAAPGLCHLSGGALGAIGTPISQVGRLSPSQP